MTVAEEGTSDWGWLSIMSACVSTQQVGGWGFPRGHCWDKTATAVVLKCCQSDTTHLRCHYSMVCHDWGH